MYFNRFFSVFYQKRWKISRNLIGISKFIFPFHSSIKLNLFWKVPEWVLRQTYGGWKMTMSCKVIAGMELGKLYGEYGVLTQNGHHYHIIPITLSLYAYHRGFILDCWPLISRRWLFAMYVRHEKATWSGWSWLCLEWTADLILSHIRRNYLLKVPNWH